MVIVYYQKVSIVKRGHQPHTRTEQTDRQQFCSHFGPRGSMGTVGAPFKIRAKIQGVVDRRISSEIDTICSITAMAWQCRFSAWIWLECCLLECSIQCSMQSLHLQICELSRWDSDDFCKGDQFVWRGCRLVTNRKTHRCCTATSPEVHDTIYLHKRTCL